MDHPYNQILLFGDSITQMSFDPKLNGFGANLANAYQRKVDVVNRGFSGYNTDWAIPILRQLIPTTERQKQLAAKILLTTIFFGANDAALPFAFQHVPLDRFKENLNTLLDIIQNPESPNYYPGMRIILITQPPLNEAQWEKRCADQGDPLNRTAEDAKKYAEAVRQVGKERGVVVADLWTRLTEVAGDNLANYEFDGLHLNSNGYQVLFDLLMETIRTHFPDVHPDAIEMELPGFRDLPRTDFDDNLQFRLLKE